MRLSEQQSPSGAGHAGTRTSEYTAKELPKRIHGALSAMVQGELRNGLNRGNVVEVAPLISDLLAREVEAFDAELGERVKAICPDPSALTEEDARAIIQENFEPLMLAWSGTTLAAALVNVTLRCVWAISVGDSSVGAYVH